MIRNNRRLIDSKA